MLLCHLESVLSYELHFNMFLFYQDVFILISIVLKALSAALLEWKVRYK